MLSDSIKEIRIKCILSQEEFAQAIGVSFSTVNRWETGKTKPNYKTLKRIDEFCKTNNVEFNLIEQVTGGNKL